MPKTTEPNSSARPRPLLANCSTHLVRDAAQYDQHTSLASCWSPHAHRLLANLCVPPACPFARPMPSIQHTEQNSSVRPSYHAQLSSYLAQLPACFTYASAWHTLPVPCSIRSTLQPAQLGPSRVDLPRRVQLGLDVRPTCSILGPGQLGRDP